MDIFAKNLKARAAQLGISNAEAARLCGLDERRYANYANDQREPDLVTLVKIARVLNISADELLGMADPRPQTERTQLLDRLNVAAAALTDHELRTIVTQTEALAIPRPKKTGKQVPTSTSGSN
ncbi:helix-turn-helix domain-containing protein [Neotabrizicola shimadae]|uniref:Helix-turn-helix transcriptional regulator n=1 Tax=Neotabrizicola shimadae TaxID=2807096 RepID=A0A8G0ZTB7_9RHOB|nr:helix-turn-helix transcriptional regulator [Neotabrizicola shimadae]QYZ68541.1 helix-turn-helix transcriptional regulator [Neotabrizicola shimadae]